MSYQPPQSPYPPPPGTPTGPEGQAAGSPPPSGYPQAPPTGPAPGTYGGPPPGYPPPAPPRPRQPISTRQLAALLLLAGAALLLLTTLLNAILADFLDFIDRIGFLGGELVVSIIVVAALLLAERSEGQFHNLIRVGALIVIGIALLFNVLGLLASLVSDIVEDKFETFVRNLGVLSVNVGAAWYAFTEFQASRPARPVAATAPPPTAYPPGYPPPQPPPQQWPQG